MLSSAVRGKPSFASGKSLGGSSVVALVPTAITLSTRYPGYTGDSPVSKMADGLSAAAGTVLATNYLANSWIMLDYGADLLVSTVNIAPINASFDGWGPGYTNGALVQYATDAAPSSWTTLFTTAGHANGVTKQYLTGLPVTARYVRITKTIMDYVAAGDFWCS
ncbi:MAG: hypothetical protein E6Q97_13065 [Desulfurellales bacterium]|nr:MAG: hypothetical protein E6Q97_13065 [Desulfurellales bacterium]